MDIDYKAELEQMQNYHSLAMQSIAKICGEDVSDEPRLKWVENIVSDIVKERDQALAKLAAMEVADKPAVSVPEGWKLVPIEPTTHQLYAAEFPIDNIISCRQSSQHAIANAAYRAMLTAAPSHSQQSADKANQWDGKGSCTKCGVGIFDRRTACPSHESEQP